MVYKAASFFALILVASIAQAAPIIEAIRFEGNEVTQDVVMLREMIVAVGDDANQEKIETSVQNIMNLGLFETVSYRNEVDGNNIVLVIVVVERYYIIPLPTAKLNGDNQLEYGVKLRWSNVWGMNHGLRWDLKKKGSDFGVNEYENKIEYQMPRIFSSRYQLALNISNQQIADDDPLNGPQRQRSTAFGFDVLKWLNADGISQGLFVRGGVGFNQKRETALKVPNTIEQRYDAIVYSAGIGYNKILEHEFNREGVLLEYKLDTSPDDRPGFNTPFTKHEITYTHLKSFAQMPPRNFNYNIVIGSSNNDVLGDKAFSMGGNTNLRGYKTSAFRGNAMVRLNLEYLSQFLDSPALRKVFFIDTGDVQETLGAIRFSSLKTGAGAGIRWKLRRFVNIDIRVDLAYGFETQEFRVGLGTHNTF